MLGGLPPYATLTSKSSVHIDHFVIQFWLQPQTKIKIDAWRLARVGDNLPRDNLPRDNIPRDDLPRDNLPRDDLPRDNLPRDNLPRA